MCIESRDISSEKYIFMLTAIFHSFVTLISIKQIEGYKICSHGLVSRDLCAEKAILCHIFANKEAKKKYNELLPLFT